jgi:hypothetical protein
MAMSRDTGKREDSFSKKEMLEMMESKVDKDILDDLVNQVTRFIYLFYYF